MPPPPGRLKILFVDDEQEVLNGLRCTLRAERGRWDLHWARGPFAALELLDREGFDVVVSDMRMPELDGASLLQEVRLRQPAALRIVLSGYADGTACARAVPVAQAWLDKPCSRERMVAVIKRAERLNATLASPLLLDLLGQRSTWPRGPAVYSRMSSLLGVQGTATPDLIDLLDETPSLAQLCKGLTAAATAGVAMETDLRRATAVHGASFLLQLVLAAELFEHKISSNPNSTIGKALLRHCVASATTACAIAEGARNTTVLPLAGLLHEAASLVATPLLAERLTMSTGHTDVRSPGAGQAPTTVGHADVGAALLSEWGAPLVLVELVAFHHRPFATSGGPLTEGAALHVADALDAELDPELGVDAPLDAEWLQREGLTGTLAQWRDVARVQRSHSTELWS